MTLEVLALIVVVLVLAGSAYFALKHIQSGRLSKSEQPSLEKSSPDSEIDSSLKEKKIHLVEDDPGLKPEISTPEASLKSDALELIKNPELEKQVTEISTELSGLPELERSSANFESALINTKQGFWGRIQSLFGDSSSEVDWDSIEEVLYTSDLGPKTVQFLMAQLNEKLSRSEKNNEVLVRTAIKEEMRKILLDSQEEDGQDLAGLEYDIFDDSEAQIKPVVWMVIGVNGSGKTTSIGKLANLLAGNGKKVMLAAGDTFRAAADAQLREWSKRANVELFSPENVKDPSAVAFDACKSALAKGYDHVIVDTAGRLHTQSNLMEELKKMKRVVDKAIPGAPHETLLVIDGNNGQNALIQAKEFNAALELTGVILTKMDGSTKGGVVLGVAHELKIPIKRIGIGEKIEDLRAFEIDSFVNAII